MPREDASGPDATADGADPARADAETAVPPGAEVHACSHCGRPFASRRHLALHRGLAHPDALDEAEREAYAAAVADEEADLRRFRLVALGVLVLVYFGFLFTYALVT